MNLTIERLKEVFTYEPETGLFKRNYSGNGYSKGAVAGCVGRRGYIQINVDRVQYRANRLAWFYMTGEFPSLVVDHIDGNTSNNTWSNLRLATASQNVMNSSLHKAGTSTNIKGIYVDKHGDIHAQVTKEGTRYRKIFKEMAKAVEWITAIREQVHGEFANHG